MRSLCSQYPILLALEAFSSSPTAPWTSTLLCYTSLPTRPCVTTFLTSKTAPNTGKFSIPLVLGGPSHCSLLRYTFQNESGKTEDKEATLTDEDKVWTEVRHMHMKDALDKLIADFKAYAGEHGGKFGGEG